MPTYITIGNTQIDISYAAIETLANNDSTPAAIDFENQVRAALQANGVTDEAELTARTEIVTGLTGYFLEHGGFDISETERLFIERFLNGTASEADMAQAYNIFRLTDPSKTPENRGYSWFSLDAADASGRAAYVGALGLGEAMAWTEQHAGADHHIDLFHIANNRINDPRGPSYAETTPLTVPGMEPFPSMHAALEAAYAQIPPNELILAAVQRQMLDDVLHHPERFPNQDDTITLQRVMEASGLALNEAGQVTPESFFAFLDPDGNGSFPGAESEIKGEILLTLLNQNAISVDTLLAANDLVSADQNRWASGWWDCALANYFHGVENPARLAEFSTLINQHLNDDPASPQMQFLRNVVDQYCIQFNADPAALQAQLHEIFRDGQGNPLPVDDVAHLLPNPDVTLAYYGLSRFPTEVEAGTEALAIERGGLNTLLNPPSAGAATLEEAAHVLDYLWQHQDQYFPEGQREAFERQVLPDLTEAILRDISDGQDSPEQEFAHYLSEFADNPELLYRFLQEVQVQNPQLFNELATSGALEPYGQTLNTYRTSQNIATDFLSPLLPDARLQQLVTDQNWAEVYNHLLTNAGTDIATSRTWQDFRALYVNDAAFSDAGSPLNHVIQEVMANHTDQLGEGTVIDQLLQRVTTTQFRALHDQFAGDGLSEQELQVLRLAYGNNPAGIDLTQLRDWPIQQLHALVGGHNETGDLALLQLYGINPADSATLDNFAANPVENVNEGQVLAYMVTNGLIPLNTWNHDLPNAYGDLSGYYRYGSNQDELRDVVEDFRADGTLSEHEIGFLTRVFASGEWETAELLAALPQDLSVAQLDQLLNDDQLLSFYGITSDPASIHAFAARNLQEVNEGQVLAYLLDHGILTVDQLSAADAGDAYNDLGGYYRYGNNGEQLANLVTGFAGDGLSESEKGFLQNLFAIGEWTPEQLRAALPDNLQIAELDILLTDSQLLPYLGITDGAPATFTDPIPSGETLHYLLTHTKADNTTYLQTDDFIGADGSAFPAFDTLQNYYIELAETDPQAALDAIQQFLSGLDAGDPRYDAMVTALFADGTLIAYLGPEVLTAPVAFSGGQTLLEYLNGHLPDEHGITAFQLATELPSVSAELMEPTLNLIAPLLAQELGQTSVTDAIGESGGQPTLNQTVIASVRNLNLRETLELVPAANRGAVLTQLLGELELANNPREAVEFLAAAGFTPADLNPDTYGLGALGIIDADMGYWQTLSGMMAIAIPPATYTVGETNAYAVNVVEEMLDGHFLFDVNNDGQVTEADKTAGLIRLAQITAVSAGRDPAFDIGDFGSVMEHFTQAPYTAADLDAFLAEINRTHQELSGRETPLDPPAVALETLLLEGNVPAEVIIHAATHGPAEETYYLTATALEDPTRNTQAQTALTDYLAAPANMAATLEAFGFGAGGHFQADQLDEREQALLNLVLTPQFLTAHRTDLMGALGIEGLTALVQAEVLSADDLAAVFHDASGRLDPSQLTALASPEALRQLLTFDTDPAAEGIQPLTTTQARALFSTGDTLDFDALVTNPALVANLIQANAFGETTVTDLAGLFNPANLPELRQHLEAEGQTWAQFAPTFLQSLADRGVSQAQFAQLLSQADGATLLAALTTTHDFGGSLGNTSILNPAMLGDAQKTTLISHFNGNVAALTDEGLTPQELALLQSLAAYDPAFAAHIAPIVLATPEAQEAMDNTPEQFFADFAPLFLSGNGFVMAGDPASPVISEYPDALIFFANRTTAPQLTLPLATESLSQLQAHYAEDHAAYEAFLEAIGADGNVSDRERQLLEQVGIPEGYTPATTLPLNNGVAVVLNGQVLSGLNQTDFTAQIDTLRQDGSLSEADVETLALLYASNNSGTRYTFPADLTPQTVNAIVRGDHEALLAAYGVSLTEPASIATFAGTDVPGRDEGAILAYLVAEEALPLTAVNADNAYAALAAHYAANPAGLQAQLEAFEADGTLSGDEKVFMARLFAADPSLVENLTTISLTFQELSNILQAVGGSETAYDAPTREAMLTYYHIDLSVSPARFPDALPNGETLHQLITTPADSPILPLEAVSANAAALETLRGYYHPNHVNGLAAIASRLTSGTGENTALTTQGEQFLAALFTEGDWTSDQIRSILPDTLPASAVDGVLNDTQLLAYYGITDEAPARYADPMPDGSTLFYLLTRPEGALLQANDLVDSDGEPLPALNAVEQYFNERAQTAQTREDREAILADIARLPLGDQQNAVIAALFEDGTLLAYLGPDALNMPFQGGTLLSVINDAIDPDISAFQLATELPTTTTDLQAPTQALITGLLTTELDALDVAGTFSVTGEGENQQITFNSETVEAVRSLRIREIVALVPEADRGTFLQTLLEGRQGDDVYELLAAAGFSPMDIRPAPAEDFYGLRALQEAGIIDPENELWARYYGTAQLINPLIYTTAEVNAYAVNVVEEMLAGGLQIDLDQNGRIDEVDQTTALSRLAAMTVYSVGRDNDNNPDTPLLFPIEDFGSVMRHFTHAPYTTEDLETFLTEMLRQQRNNPDLDPPVIDLERLMLQGNVPAPVLIHAITHSTTLEGVEAPIPYLSTAALNDPERNAQVKATLTNYLAEPGNLSATLSAFGFGAGGAYRADQLDESERAILNLVFDETFIQNHRSEFTALGLNGLIALEQNGIISPAELATVFHDAAGNLDASQLALLTQSGGLETLLTFDTDLQTEGVQTLTTEQVRAFFTDASGSLDFDVLASNPALVVDLIQANAFGTDTAQQLAGILATENNPAAYLQTLAREGLSRAQFAELLEASGAAMLLTALTTTHDFGGTAGIASLFDPVDLSGDQKGLLIAYLEDGISGLTSGGLTAQELDVLQTLTLHDRAFAASIADDLLATPEAQRAMTNNPAEFFTDFSQLFLNADGSLVQSGDPARVNIASQPEALVYFASHTTNPALTLNDANLGQIREAFATTPALYDQLLSELGENGLTAAERELLTQIGTGWFPEGYEPRVQLAENTEVTVGELMNLQLAGGPYRYAQLLEYAEEYLAVPGGELPAGFTRDTALASFSAAVIASAGNASLRPEIAEGLEDLFLLIPDQDRAAFINQLITGLGAQGFKTLVQETAASPNPNLPALLALLSTDHDQNAATALFSSQEAQALWPNLQDDFATAFTTSPASDTQLDTVRALASFTAIALGSPPANLSNPPAAGFEQELLAMIQQVPAEYMDQFRDAWLASYPDDLRDEATQWFEANLLRADGTRLTTAQLNELLREGDVTGTVYNELAVTAVTNDFTALAAGAGAVASEAEAEALGRDAYRLLDSLPEGATQAGYLDDILTTLPAQYRDEFLDTVLREYAADQGHDLANPDAARAAQTWLTETLLGGTVENNTLLDIGNPPEAPTLEQQAHFAMLFELASGAPLGDGDPATNATERQYALDRSGFSYINPANILSHPALGPAFLTSLTRHHSGGDGVLSDVEAQTLAQDMAALAYSYLTSNPDANLQTLDTQLDLMASGQALDDFFREMERLYQEGHPGVTGAASDDWLLDHIEKAGLTYAQLQALSTAEPSLFEADNLEARSRMDALLRAAQEAEATTPTVPGANIEGYYQATPEANAGESEGKNCVTQLFSAWFGLDNEEALETDLATELQNGGYIITSYGDDTVSEADMVLPPVEPAMEPNEAVRVVGGLTDFANALDRAMVDTVSRGTITQDELTSIQTAFDELANDLGAGATLSFTHGAPAVTVTLVVGADGKFYAQNSDGSIGTSPYQLSTTEAQALYQDAMQREATLPQGNQFLIPSMQIHLESGQNINTNMIIPYGILENAQAPQLLNSMGTEVAQAYAQVVEDVRGTDRSAGLFQ